MNDSWLAVALLGAAFGAFAGAFSERMRCWHLASCQARSHVSAGAACQWIADAIKDGRLYVGRRTL